MDFQTLVVSLICQTEPSQPAAIEGIVVRDAQNGELLGEKVEIVHIFKWPIHRMVSISRPVGDDWTVCLWDGENSMRPLSWKGTPITSFKFLSLVMVTS